LPLFGSWFCRAAVEPKGRNGEESGGGGGREEEVEEEVEEVADAEGDVASCPCLSDSLARRVVGTLFIARAPGEKKSSRLPATVDGRIAGNTRR
jgi:hypothetical protein